VALDWKCADKLTAIALGCAGIVIGHPGMIAGGAVGAAGLLGAWRAAKTRHGLESNTLLARVRKTVLADCEVWARAEGMAEADLKAADLALERHLADCIPDLATLAGLARHRARYSQAVAGHIVAELAKRDGLFNKDASQFSQHAHDLALQVVDRALADAMLNEDYAAKLRTAMMVETLSGLREVQDTVEAADARGAAADSQHGAKLDAILAVFNTQQTPAGVPRETVLAIAQRVNDMVSDVDSAVATIHAALDELILLRDRAARGSNLGGLVDEALCRIAERNARNEFDAAAQAGEDAYAVLIGRQRAERIALADAMIGQSRVRVEAAELARWEEERLRIETPVLSAEALFDLIERYRETGLSQGLPLELDVAILLAKRSLALARSDWEKGAAQNHLGNALAAQGERIGGAEGIALLANAVAAYRAALQVYTRAALPAGWAMTQNNLGVALRVQGARSGGGEGIALLAAAVASYRVALEVYTRAALPADWAMTQNNLGIALATQGERSGGDTGIALLAEAVAAYRAALEVYTPEALPAQWATTQNNLAAALATQGESSGGAKGIALLAEAVAAFRASLEIRTREALPTYWATTQENIGLAFESMGNLAEGAERIANWRAAEQASLCALEVYDPLSMAFYYDKCVASLARVRARLAGDGEAPEPLLRAG